MTRHKFTLICTVAMVFGSSLAYAQATEQTKPLRVLILSGRNNHDWRKTTPVLHQMYNNSIRFAADVTEDPTTCTADVLAEYDVVVSNWCAWPDVNGRQWGPEVEKAFVDFVRGGKGFALFHAASATFHNWPEYQPGSSARPATGLCTPSR